MVKPRGEPCHNLAEINASPWSFFVCSSDALPCRGMIVGFCVTAGRLQGLDDQGCFFLPESGPPRISQAGAGLKVVLGVQRVLSPGNGRGVAASRLYNRHSIFRVLTWEVSPF